MLRSERGDRTKVGWREKLRHSGTLAKEDRKKEVLDEYLGRLLGYAVPSADPQHNIKAAEPCLRSQRSVPSFDYLFSSLNPDPLLQVMQRSKFSGFQGTLSLSSQPG